MQEQNRYSNQTLNADLFLLHAPSVYDFHERDDFLFAYLSDFDTVNVTLTYEIYPIGFFSIKQRLCEAGFKTEMDTIKRLTESVVAFRHE